MATRSPSATPCSSPNAADEHRAVRAVATVGAVTNRLLLGPMLRYVDDTTATIWCETSDAGTVDVLGTPTPTFNVRGRHYALVVIEGLQPGSTTEYDVRLDGEVVWPEPDSDLPPSIIRTTSPDMPVSILTGSCRAAAPHEPPYTLELAMNADGRGVDTMWAHAERMTGEPPDRWPTLLLLVGDQIYADDSSPRTEERIEQLRGDDSDLPPEIVATFEEYCWLYQEAWSPRLERWMFSVVPSLMIFDDHDMIDDWNISDSWRREIHVESWWGDHATGGLMSYWIYQHLGNLSPAQIERDGLLRRLYDDGDGSETLERWAEHSETTNPDEGGYCFSVARTVGEVTIVLIDSRNGRRLEPDHRRMVADVEWAWIREQALGAGTRHIVLATSLPVFLSDGLHELQVWSELVVGGRWGRLFVRPAEKLRRALDLEDWSAFHASYEAFVALIHDLTTLDDPPDTVVIASGDIHFSYTAVVPHGTDRTRVHQVVASPIRNALIPHERSIMRFALTRTGARIGRVLRWLARGPRTAPHIGMTSGPYFANNMAEIHYRGRDVDVTVEHSTPDDDGAGTLDEVAHVAI